MHLRDHSCSAPTAPDTRSLTSPPPERHPHRRQLLHARVLPFPLAACRFRSSHAWQASGQSSALPECGCDTPLALPAAVPASPRGSTSPPHCGPTQLCSRQLRHPPAAKSLHPLAPASNLLPAV